jgi:hypothetical protein
MWYGDASLRSAAPQGPARLMFAPDLVGPSAQIVERLHGHAAFRGREPPPPTSSTEPAVRNRG